MKGNIDPMKKVISLILELCRLIILLVLTLYVLNLLERNLTKIITGRTDFYWSMTIGNIFLFFVIYRNFLQFNGWYRSEQNIKLNRMTSIMFILISIGLIVVPIIINIK